MEGPEASGYHDRFVWILDRLRGFRGPFVLAGLRMYLMGLENGGFEGRWNGVWNLPIKVADSIDFGVSLNGERILWLKDHCVRCEAHVSHAERVYVLPNGLTIREKVFIPDVYRAVCWLFRFEGVRNLGLKFIAKPVINLMWEVRQAGEPWREKRMLAVYDRARRALIFRHHMRPEWLAIFGGSLEPSVVSVGHQEGVGLPRENRIPGPREHIYGEALMVYDLRLGDGDSLELSFVLVGGVASLIFLLREYDEAARGVQELFERSRKSVMDYLLNTVDLSVGHAAIDKAFTWSKVNLHLLKHYQRGYGLGFMAGLPHFPIYFGRDTVWTLFGINAIGDFEASKGSLSLLARFQAKEDGEDQLMVPYYKGEVPHEVRTDGTVIYYSIDSTPLFVVGVYDYYLWSGDEVFLRYIYDNVHKALAWCFESDRDGDGLVDHGPEGFLPDVTWMDSTFRGKSAIDVQAIFAYAFKCGAEIAKVVGDVDMEKAAHRKYEELKDLLIKRYWDEERGFFYDAIKPDGEPSADMTVNAVVPLLFNLVEEEKADKVLCKLESPDFMTDWGVRTRAKSDPEYDGRSYQKGGVWPFTTGWVALAQFRYGRLSEGYDTILRMAEAQHFIPAYFREVLPGDGSIKEALSQHPLGCFIQAWSAGIYLYSLITGLMEVEPRARLAEATVCPYMHSSSIQLYLDKLRVGSSMLDLKLKRNGRMVEAKLHVEGRDLDLNLGFRSKGSSMDCDVKLDGSDVESYIQPVGKECFKVLARVKVKEGQTVKLTYRLK